MAEPPNWLESLVDVIAECMEPHNVMGPLAFRWRNENDHWEITVYPTPAELIGGAEDGAVVSPGFSLDVQNLSTLFEELVDVRWQAQAFGPNDHLGQHISVEGVYYGHEIYLQVLSEAPDDEEPGFKFAPRSGYSPGAR